MKNTILLLFILTLFASSCTKPEEDSYNPVDFSSDIKQVINNYEAVIPPQCYTKTEGVSNPCWACHTTAVTPNQNVDFMLQEEYAFSNFALTNRWDNLFRERSGEIDKISEDQVYEYIRTDNYTPLREKMDEIDIKVLWKPDLDFNRGFDEKGFAKDGSWWRALRYKPFLGTFWPTNGNTDDVFIRLGEEFRTDEKGNISEEIYKINLAILEALVGCDPGVKKQDCRRSVEPVSEEKAGIDLNRDGKIDGTVTEIVGIPEHWAGKAKDYEIKKYLFPKSTEFLHTVRYIDPDSPGLLSKRMKEVRYSKKTDWLDTWALNAFNEREFEEKEEGKLPKFGGSPITGIDNKFGWRFQGYIEDAGGRLRLQTLEEHQYCMGCHGSLGITVDKTFTMPRKVPGKDGWKHQNLEGIKDFPQAGHSKPEIYTYFERVRGGDEFRANDEIIHKFFPDGNLDKEKVLTASPGGKNDITYLVYPSRQRALQLNKAYMALVKEQSFEKGRDTLLKPPVNVHRNIKNGSTDLGKSGKIFYDGRLWLDWEYEGDSNAKITSKNH